jgi:phytoene dehydrogenase-like protein
MVYSDAVVLNIPLYEIPRLVQQEYLPKQLNKLLQNFEPSSSIIMDIASSDEIIQGKNDTIVSLEPLAIFRVPTKYDNTLAPQGKHILSAWMPIASDKSHNRKYLETRYAEVQRIMNKIFPGLAQNSTIIRRMVFSTTIGFYPKPSMNRLKRPNVTLQGLKNLYLVGDAVNVDGIGGSSDATFNSAMQCVELIKQQFSAHSREKHMFSLSIDA